MTMNNVALPFLLMIVICGGASYIQFHLYEISKKKFNLYLAYLSLILVLINFIAALVLLKIR